MRKIIISFVVLSFILSMNTFLHAEEKNQKTEVHFSGKVMENGIRVRSDKNASSQVLGNLYKGEKIDVLERSKEKEKIQDMEDYWYKIKYQNGTGWVYGHFLITEEPVENLKGTVNADNVHIRKEFDLGTEVIGKVFKNDNFSVITKTNKQLDVEGKQDYWYKIQMPDNTFGWIFGEFLTLSTQK